VGRLSGVGLLNPVDREKLREELRGDEDLRLVVYDDATGEPLKPGDTLRGHPTIGIGRALDTNGISREEAYHLLENDIDEVEAAVAKRLPWARNLNGVRRRVILTLAFNLGIGGLLTFKRALAAAKREDFDESADEFLDSLWATQVKGRAIRLMQKWRTGEE
jgi:lysozyme